MRRTVSPILLAAALLGACGAAQQPTASTPDPDPPPLPWTTAGGQLAAIDSPLVALVGGTVMTATGRVIEDGVVVMEDGRLRAVGARSEVEIPEGARQIDVTGRFVTPGLIDTHSHMGVYPSPHIRATSDGNEMSDPTTPEVRAADAFWPQDPQLPRAIAGGVTTVQILPGSGNLIGGAGSILKLHLGRTVEEMEFPGAPETLKMACGENPKRVYGGRNSFPMTRMGNVFGYRQAFQQAIEYGRSYSDWQAQHVVWQRGHQAFLEAEASGEEGAEDPGPAPAPPARDFGLERLLGAREGRVLIQMHCYRAEEMARMIQVGDELGFRIRSFHHAVEAYKIRDLLAQNDIAISTWADWWGFKLEAYDTVEENLALLTQAGVRGILHSDSAMLIQRLNQEAGKAMAAGRRAGIEITDDQALRWITINAAWALGVQDQTGSLEEGKMADVVVWSGHPFSVYSRADLVFIDGLTVFDRSEGPDPLPRTDFELGQDLELTTGGE
ncbi:MAG: amidohydrolase [Sandaracinaceae bacterium]|nr:amidohydrolase [Sandaracinaceae bacterium]